jgi:hypothetical protein
MNKEQREVSAESGKEPSRKRVDAFVYALSGDRQHLPGEYQDRQGTKRTARL